MEILLSVFIFYAGVSVGFLIKLWLNYRRSYDGTIIVTKEVDKTVYSLVLESDPELIEFEKELIFKVAPFGENHVRD